PLSDLQAELFELHGEAKEEYKEALSEWKKLAKGERGEQPEPPAEPAVFFTSDVTIETLGLTLEANPKGLVAARDELDAWLQSFVRYKGKGGGNDRAQWLELHQAATLRVDRMSREQRRLTVRHAAVSITGTIQPHTLQQAFDQDAMHAGLGARFLMT